MKKIKILTVTANSFRKKDGISTVILDYYSRFDPSRFEIHVVVYDTCNPDLAKEFENAGMVLKRLPSRKDRLGKYLRALAGLLRRERYDAIHVHGSSALMAAELELAKFFGCRVRVAHSHNTTCDHKKADRLLRPLFYRSYTDAIACGEEAGKWLYEQNPFRVMKNGRDVSQYHFSAETREKIRKQLGLDYGVTAIGHVGNFNLQKNQRYTLEVFREVLKRRPDARLYLMGDGSLFEKTTDAARQMGLSEQVVFTGSISNVADMLQAMDVMVLPSLHEGLPLVAVEWQIACLPCLLSDSITRECAYSELVEYLPLSCSYGDWAEKLLEMAGRTDRNQIAEQMAKLTAENGYDIDRNAEELQDFFTGKCK